MLVYSFQYFSSDPACCQSLFLNFSLQFFNKIAKFEKEHPIVKLTAKRLRHHSPHNLMDSKEEHSSSKLYLYKDRLFWFLFRVFCWMILYSLLTSTKNCKFIAHYLFGLFFLHNIIFINSLHVATAYCAVSRPICMRPILYDCLDSLICGTEQKMSYGSIHSKRFFGVMEEAIQFHPEIGLVIREDNFLSD